MPCHAPQEEVKNASRATGTPPTCWAARLPGRPRLAFSPCSARAEGVARTFFSGTTRYTSHTTRGKRQGALPTAAALSQQLALREGSFCIRMGASSRSLLFLSLSPHILLRCCCVEPESACRPLGDQPRFPRTPRYLALLSLCSVILEPGPGYQTRGLTTHPPSRASMCIFGLLGHFCVFQTTPTV